MQIACSAGPQSPSPQWCIARRFSKHTLPPRRLDVDWASSAFQRPVAKNYFAWPPPAQAQAAAQVQPAPATQAQAQFQYQRSIRPKNSPFSNSFNEPVPAQLRLRICFCQFSFSAFSCPWITKLSNENYFSFWVDRPHSLFYFVPQENAILAANQDWLLLSLFSRLLEKFWDQSKRQGSFALHWELPSSIHWSWKNTWSCKTE